MRVKFLLILWALLVSSISLSREVEGTGVNGPLPERYQVGSHLVVEEPTKLRTASFFAGSTYLKGILPEGSLCQILNVDMDKKSGVGVYVKVISGPKEGQVGWVYYHHDSNDRTVSLHMADGSDIDLDSKADVREQFADTKRYLKENTDDFVEATTVLPAQYKIVETEDEIWDNVYNGKYTISTVDPIDGTILVTKPYQTASESGKVKVENVTITLPYDFKRMLTLSTEVNKRASGESAEASCDNGSNNPEYKDYKFLKGCDVLKKGNLTDDYDKLATCLDSIKKVATKDGVTNSKVKKNLYKLNPLEQEFAGMTLTAYGESGIIAPPLEEMVIVMKTLENRARYAREEGFKKANALDAAIQKSQYSMWSNGFKNKKTGKFEYEQWKPAITASAHNNNTVNSIKSFILYKKSKFSPKTTSDDIYHYHTNYVSPDWKNSRKVVKVKVNNKSLKQRGTRHIFYRNIPWTFEYTKYKPTSQR